jgi:hypothetical protein
MLHELTRDPVAVPAELERVRTRVVRRRRQHRTMLICGILTACIATIAITVALANSNDRVAVQANPGAIPRATPPVETHTGPNGATYGPLGGSSTTSAHALYASSPDYIAVLRGDLSVVGYVKKTDLFDATTTPTVFSRRAVLPAYTEDDTEIGHLVNRRLFATRDATTGTLSTTLVTLDPSGKPIDTQRRQDAYMRRWWERDLDSCLTEQLFDPASDGNGEMRMFDQATRGEIVMPYLQFCRERAALSPDPTGAILATMYGNNGHVAATYYHKIPSGNTTTNGPVIPNREARRIIARQRAAAEKAAER